MSVTARTMMRLTGSVEHVADEAAVDLDDVHRQVLQIGERGHAGTEIVQRHLAAHRTQALMNRATCDRLRTATVSVISKHTRAGSIR